MPRRVSVLLGAGASVEAGLPMTNELASQLIDELNSRHSSAGRDPEWLKALNFAYGAMVGYQSQEGDNPNRAVSIERLISSLRLLSEKDNREAAPFVAAWKAGADGFARSARPQIDTRDLVRAIEKIRNPSPGRRVHNAESDLRRALEKYLTTREAVIPGESSFSEAEKTVVRGVAEVLSQHQAVSYLVPIADFARTQSTGIDVLSLNYDLVIENLCENNGLTLERGLSSWTPGNPMNFHQSGAAVRLYKMHGSVDWYVKPSDSEVLPPTYITGDSDDLSKRTVPWIVIGDREKLSTPGPILDLLRAVEDALRESDHLVVVGYSFADAHINSLLSHWLSSDDSRTMSIVDPFWSKNATKFHQDLVNVYGAKPLRDGSYWQPRLFIHRSKTGDSIGEALYDTQKSPAEPIVSFEMTHRIDGVFDVVLIDKNVSGPVYIELGTAGKGHGIDHGDAVTIEAIGVGDCDLSVLTHLRGLQLEVINWAVGDTLRVRTLDEYPAHPCVAVHYKRLDSATTWTTRKIFDAAEVHPKAQSLAPTHD